MRFQKLSSFQNFLAGQSIEVTKNKSWPAESLSLLHQNFKLLQLASQSRVRIDVSINDA